MVWVRCFRCEKFQNDFMAQTFVLIAPVQPVLHQASCINETIQNIPKHYETQQYMSLESNGVGRVHSLRKIPERLHAQTCALIAPVQTVLHRVSCSNKTLPNAPKHEFRVQWSGSGAFVVKNSKTTSWHKLVH